MKEMEAIVGKLREKGARITPVRKAMVSVLIEAKGPLSILEIGRRLARKGHAPNKTTLYREMDFLVRGGWIHELDFGDGRKCYEWKAGHHHHLVCRNCQAVEEIEVGELESAFGAFEKKLGKKSNFASVSHSLEFYGTCNHCR